MRYGFGFGWPHGVRCLWWCSGHRLYPPCLLPWLHHGPQDWSEAAKKRHWNERWQS